LAKIIGCGAESCQGKLTGIEDDPVLWRQHKIADGQTGLIYTRWIKQKREACELSPMLQASSDR